MRALTILLIALPLQAQFRKVEMRVGGLDCNSCSESVDRVLKRIRGVESASFDAKANLVTVSFKAENKVALEAIRDAVKSIGYTPGETQLSARGSLAQEDGKWQFKPAGIDRTYAADIPSDLLSKAGADIIVDGSLPAPQGANQPETLRVKGIHKSD